MTAMLDTLEDDPQAAQVQSLEAFAFGQGCDSRLAGQRRSSCPYTGSRRQEAYREKAMWLFGWDHVDQHWGADARWPVRPLPPVVALVPRHADAL